MTNYALSEPCLLSYVQACLNRYLINMTTLKGFVAFQESKSLYPDTSNYSPSQMKKRHFKQAVNSPLWVGLIIQLFHGKSEGWYSDSEIF